MKNTKLALLLSVIALTSTGLMNANTIPEAPPMPPMPKAAPKPAGPGITAIELQRAEAKLKPPGGGIEELFGNLTPEILAEYGVSSESKEAVEDLDALLNELKDEGVTPGDVVEEVKATIDADPDKTALDDEVVASVRYLFSPSTVEEEEVKVTVAGKRIPVLPGLFQFYTDQELRTKLDNLKSRHVAAALNPAKKKQTKHLQTQIDILNRILANRAKLTPAQKAKREANLKKNLMDRRAKVLFRLTTAKAKPLTPQRDRIVNRLTKRLEGVDALLERTK